MAKGYFTFKQFTVWQDKAAMKVCTDSCLFGAAIPLAEGVQNILDIGTGTGLLALMLAQRSPAGVQIDAVELETDAAEQARQNFLGSPWAEQLTLFETSIQNFASNSQKQYDLIICNPPFYKQSLPRAGTAANLAMHSIGLSQQELLDAVLKLLSPKGCLALLLPPYEMEQFARLGNTLSFYVADWTDIYEKAGGKLIRVIATFTFTPGTYEKQIIAIKDEKGEYSSQFAALLKEFYLIF